jgi:hypothetical protein
MTYITPDALAMRQEMRDPWSKRGMVARAHLRQGNSLDATLPLLPEVPYSPMQLQRRFPPKAAVARYPLDPGWADPSVSGLGEVDPVAEEMEQLATRMKQNLIAQTAAVTAVSIAIQFVPIVGQIIGGVLLVVNSLVGAALRREGERLMADFQDELMRAGASYQDKVTQAHSLIFEQEKPAAIAMALSGQALNGLGALDGKLSKIFSSDVFHTIVNPLRVIKLNVINPILTPAKLIGQGISKLPLVGKAGDKVEELAFRAEEQVDRPIKAVDQAVDTITGVKGLQDVEKAINAARPQAYAQMESQAVATINKINSPAYREVLRNNIAKAIRSSASIQAFQTGMVVPEGTVAPSNLSALPAAAAAGGILLLLVGLGK